MKILELIEKKLKEKALKEHHQVVKLQWQRAELERKITEAKRDKNRKINFKTPP